jgi:hypothetical protein
MNVDENHTKVDYCHLILKRDRDSRVPERPHQNVQE